MGAIASDNVNNLGFFSRVASITTPLKQNPVPSFTYNSSKTYISFVIGDGDNVAYLKGSRKRWMEERLSLCQDNEAACFPLLWSLSPQLLHLAPEWIQWFYNASYQTGKDYFVLPPSGDLYSYPSQMPADAQANFVANTERVSQLMSTNALVGWETTTSWGNAFATYFPRYSARNIVQGVFAVNVPYLFDTLGTFGNNYYRMAGANTVVFRPREWRGTNEKNLGKSNNLSVQDMAAEINGYAPGTVTHLYCTSDGGFDLQDLTALVALMGEQVEIVDSFQLTEAAISRG
jgi:hypothetical protein